MSSPASERLTREAANLAVTSEALRRRAANYSICARCETPTDRLHQVVCDCWVGDESPLRELITVHSFDVKLSDLPLRTVAERLEEDEPPPMGFAA